MKTLCRLLLAVLTIAAFCSQQADSRTLEQNELWRAHAIYQSYVQKDFTTPLVLRALVANIRANPSVSYDDLLHFAVQARHDFLESKQYADLGKTADPFSTDNPNFANINIL